MPLAFYENGKSLKILGWYSRKFLRKNYDQNFDGVVLTAQRKLKKLR